MNGDSGGGQTRAEPSGWTVDTTRAALSSTIDRVERTGFERVGFLTVLGAVITFVVWRRLGDLNHENARILAAQQASVSSDKFDGTLAVLASEKQTLDARVVGIEQQLAQSATKEDVTRSATTEIRAHRGEVRLTAGTLISVVLLIVAVVSVAVAIRGR